MTFSYYVYALIIHLILLTHALYICIKKNKLVYVFKYLYNGIFFSASSLYSFS